MKFNDTIESEAEYKNGYKNGIEYIYNSDGNLEQANENRGNVIFGISKEYDADGNTVIASIVYNNDYLRSVESVDDRTPETKVYDDKFGNSLPEYIQKLMKLSNKEIFNYEFKINNPSLHT